jgi:L-fuculose-phosphate aldolase
LLSAHFPILISINTLDFDDLSYQRGNTKTVRFRRDQEVKEERRRRIELVLKLNNKDSNRITITSSASSLVRCVHDLYRLGLTSSVSGNHSIRYSNNSMLITPSAVPRYNLKISHLVKMDLQDGMIYGKTKPSIEWQMHRGIYNSNSRVGAIVHTHSPFTLGVAISSGFRQVIEEAKLVVGHPSIIKNYPSGSKQLAREVAGIFGRTKSKAVIIRNHGVVAIGRDIDDARAVVESLEEWSKILTVSEIFGGPKYYL